MNTVIKHARKQLLITLASSGLAILAGSGPLYADDIEIFVAGEDPNATGGAEPNIMFIIDTSGSMGNTVKTQVDWDPALTFSGPYSSSRVYWNTSNKAPSSDTSRYFDKSRNFCESSKKVFLGGAFYQGQVLAWRGSGKASKRRWYPLSSDNRNRDVECKADKYIEDSNGNRTPHGQAFGDGKPYAADGQSGPYASDTKNEPSWNDTYYLFDGNRLNWEASGGTVEKQRLKIVQEVVSSMLDALSGVNVGLMRFNDLSGGPVLIPMQPVTSVKTTMQNEVNKLSADGWTPLSETFYEFGQYMYGKNVDYGDGHEHQSSANSRVGNTLSSKTYKSPVEFACQKNYVVYLTDGAPTEDVGAESKIENLPDFKKHTGNAECQNDHGSSNGKCLDELAEYYAKADINTQLTGDQTITTYTIGFTVDLPLLADTARKGGGKYFQADNTAELASALTKITVEILDDSTTFTAPAVPVNSFNRTQTLSSIYTSLFQPSSSVHWPGNLKRYSFKNGEFIGQDGLPAIDEADGFFKDSAWSYWTNRPDGDTVPAGGAAEQIPSFVSRKVYTDIVGNNLTSAENRITTTNTNITAATLGAASGTITINGQDFDQRDHIVAWLMGMDVFDDNDNNNYTDDRRQVGDPLHVRPVPVVYGGTVDAPDVVVFITTNDGQLHAVDGATGEELWTYIPGSILNRMHKVYDDEVTPIKNYNLDGQPVVYVMNDDGQPGYKNDEKVVMVFGMRRGGTKYFALDITDKSNPVKLWEIDDRIGGEFEDMGQTWSTPQIGRVDLGGTDTPVAFFGGGYDDGQDNSTFRTDTVGNAVYMVNLLTGKKLWSAGPDSSYDLQLAKMEHSIPAPLRVIDVNLDGYIDRIYTGDMGGRIWRFDLFNGNSAATFGEGGIIASLGAADLNSPTAADVRRFYNQIDAAESRVGLNRYFALNVGSGYRAHPLDRTTDEEFFSIRDFKAYDSLKSDDAFYSTPVVRSDLTDITDPLTSALPYDTKGWRLRLIQADLPGNKGGEKVLGRSLTIAGAVLFTTFSPGATANTCSAAKGKNRLYAVSLSEGRPVLNLDGKFVPVPVGTAGVSNADYSEELNFGGLGSEVHVIFSGDQNGYSSCVSLSCGAEPIDGSGKMTFWTEGL